MKRCPTALASLAGLLLSSALVSGEEDERAAGLADAIDRWIEARIEAAGLVPAPRADDAEFLRRVYLDLHGVVPPAERAVRFLERRESAKRAELIDELLESPRYGERLGEVWSRRLVSPLLLEDPNQMRQVERFAAWLAERFRSGAGWDRAVRELLTATGKLGDNPAVTYLIEGRNPLGVADLTNLTSRYFLGVRLGCAQCHDHPYTDWKQEDYWGMAAFFAQIQTPGRPKMVHRAGVRDDPAMTLASLRDGGATDGFQPRAPRFLGGEALTESSETPYRTALARWITSPENPYFARAAANRMWWRFFGRGIVEPAGDMHPGNPPSHPELLDLLARRLVESGFDLKLLARAILRSRTYQRTSRGGEQAGPEIELFARMPVKVLSAGELYDSLVAVLGPPAKAPGIDSRLGARHEFTRFFASGGDPDPRRYERGIPHILRLMNSPQFAGANLDALVDRVARPGRAVDDVVSELYLGVLTRRPERAELEIAREHVAGGDAAREGAYRELAWALLISSEFTLNH